MRAYLREIVQRGEHGAPLAVPTLDQRDEIGDGLAIDGAERLVEQDDGGVLQEQAREQHALELAARERADETVGQVLQSDRGESVRDLIAIVAVDTVPSADLPPQPHGRAVEHRDGKLLVDRDLLREVGDSRVPQTAELDASAQRPKLAGDALEQGRLAGAVGADDGEQRPGLDVAGHVMNGRMPVVAERRVVEGNRRHASRHATSRPTTRSPRGAPRRRQRGGADP